MKSWEVWLSQSLRLVSNLVRALFVRNIYLYSNSKIKATCLIPKPKVNVKLSDFTLQVLNLRLKITRLTRDRQTDRQVPRWEFGGWGLGLISLLWGIWFMSLGGQMVSVSAHMLACMHTPTAALFLWEAFGLRDEKEEKEWGRRTGNLWLQSDKSGNI